MFELSSWLEWNRDHSFQTLSLYTFNPILDSFTDYSIKQACSTDSRVPAQRTVVQCHIDWYLLRLSVCLIKLCWTFYRYWEKQLFYFFSKRVRYWVLVRTLLHLLQWFLCSCLHLITCLVYLFFRLYFSEFPILHGISQKEESVNALKDFMGCSFTDYNLHKIFPY